jgi:hypothetical protein
MFGRITILALVSALVSGCQFFNPVGIGIQLGIYWKEGQANKYYPNDVQSVAVALRASLKQLDIQVTSDEQQNGDVHIKAGVIVTLAQGPTGLGSKPPAGRVNVADRFTIHVYRVNAKVSRLAIRVNVFGDKPFAELIYRTMDRHPAVRQFESEKELRGALNP